MQVVASLKARLFAFQTMIMQRESTQEVSMQILLQRVQRSVSITGHQPRKLPPLACFNISGTTLRIIMNNSIFQEEWEKSKGARNIRNISVLVGYEQGFVILIPVLLKSKKLP